MPGVLCSHAIYDRRRTLRQARHQPSRGQNRTPLAATPFAGFEACARALQNYAYADLLPHIAVPTLLIVGKDDGKMPETMAHMRDAIAKSHLVEIAAAGHIPNIAQPDRFNGALEAFLF